MRAIVSKVQSASALRSTLVAAAISIPMLIACGSGTSLTDGAPRGSTTTSGDAGSTTDSSASKDSSVAADSSVPKDSGSDVSAAPTCSDGAKNGSESDVDCGGSCATKCANDKACAGDSDCTSGLCDATAKKCAATACSDTVKNGDETDIDCGGSCPTKCADTKGCAADGDCASGVCDEGASQCLAPACDDTVKNGTESDVDCGGSCTTKCADTQACAVADDCESHVCTANVCASDEGWAYNGGYWQLSHSSPSQPFTASDCDPPSFADRQATVNGIPFDVGDVGLAKQAAIPEGVSTVNAPFSNFVVNNVYMLVPGGRGGAKQLSITFTYVDDTTVVADPFTVPHDCGGGGPFTDDVPVNETLTSQGQYANANTCCNFWWDGVWINPDPAKAVKSITINYESANNAGWGTGRVWAVSIN